MLVSDLIIESHDSERQSRIENDIRLLAANPRNYSENPDNHARAAEWIAREFELAGLTVTRQSFEFPGEQTPRKGINIVGTWIPLITDRAGSANSPPILIGAHYDTVPGSPGADDNASGVSAMLECARALTNRSIDRPVTFVAFDAEELQPPLEGLHGSTEYVLSLT
ncbi:MAG: M20/M25/M40 family metallo-hydrolase [Chloroflexi bacterium]|nr:M20/M25/M40 family metallo-hydrolase [Chloroflexota bacterium]